MYTLTHSHIKLNVLYKKQNRNEFLIFFPLTLTLIQSFTLVYFRSLSCSFCCYSALPKLPLVGPVKPSPVFTILSEDANQLRIFSTPFVLRIFQKILCHPFIGYFLPLSSTFYLSLSLSVGIFFSTKNA